MRALCDAVSAGSTTGDDHVDRIALQQQLRQVLVRASLPAKESDSRSDARIGNCKDIGFSWNVFYSKSKFAFKLYQIADVYLMQCFSTGVPWAYIKGSAAMIIVPKAQIFICFQTISYILVGIMVIMGHYVWWKAVKLDISSTFK